MLAIRGLDAPAKARRTADALLARTRAQLRAQGLADYSETCVELLGCESLYGPHARELPTREVVLRIAVRHAEAQALKFLQRECASSGTSMGPGTRSSFSGRADVQPVIKVFSFLVPKARVPLQVRMGGLVEAVVAGPVGVACADDPQEPGDRCDAIDGAAPPLPALDAGSVTVPLVRLAWARSGDKGDDANIGVIARQPEYLPILRAQLTAQRVRDYFSHLVAGAVERYDVPGLHAMNFVLHEALGGGGVCSLRSDPLGKSMAQMLLDLPVAVPRAMLAP